MITFRSSSWLIALILKLYSVPFIYIIVGIKEKEKKKAV
jgi:hypothetical protein